MPPLVPAKYWTLQEQYDHRQMMLQQRDVDDRDLYGEREYIEPEYCD